MSEATIICSMCDGTGRKSFTGNPFPREKCPSCNGSGTQRVRQYVYKADTPTCPRCDHVFTTDEMHNGEHDLYAAAPDERRLEIKCPCCGEPFWLQGGYTPEYTSAVEEEDL